MILLCSAQHVVVLGAMRGDPSSGDLSSLSFSMIDPAGGGKAKWVDLATVGQFTDAVVVVG